MFEFLVKRLLTSWSKQQVLDEKRTVRLNVQNSQQKRQLTGCLSGNAFEDIVDETVENSHRLVGDTSIRVDLLED